jgi:hypothetical protein
MHRYNNKYGYGQILKNYCGVSKSSIIWGEIQHSLFMSTNYIRVNGTVGPRREQFARFPRLLSWQTVLPFPHQVPIGMPIGYLLRLNKGGFSLPEELRWIGAQKFSLIMPRMDKDLSLEERVVRYGALVQEAIASSPDTLHILAPHPAERVNRETLDERFSANALVLWRGGNEAVNDPSHTLALFQHAGALWSDYFGTHVFQATAFFGTMCRVIGKNAFRVNYHENINQLLLAFGEARDYPEQMSEVAAKLLGLQHLRSPEELTNILGFQGLRRLSGRPVKAIYRKYRQAKVHIRQGLGMQTVQSPPN